MGKILPDEPRQPTANAEDSVVTRDRDNDFAMGVWSVNCHRVRSPEVVAELRGESAGKTPLGGRRQMD